MFHAWSHLNKQGGEKLNLILERKKSGETGIYGELCSEDGKFVAKTLEHAYINSSEVQSDTSEKPILWEGKVPIGTYRCVRGQHRLHSSAIAFETFMVTKVPDHEGILFHIGNYNKDSEGCILLGLTYIPDGIGRSADAFRNFMELQRGCGEFFLEVKNA